MAGPNSIFYKKIQNFDIFYLQFFLSFFDKVSFFDKMFFSLIFRFEPNHFFSLTDITSKYLQFPRAPSNFCMFWNWTNTSGSTKTELRLGIWFASPRQIPIQNEYTLLVDLWGYPFKRLKVTWNWPFHFEPQTLSFLYFLRSFPHTKSALLPTQIFGFSTLSFTENRKKVEITRNLIHRRAEVSAIFMCIPVLQTVHGLCEVPRWWIVSRIFFMVTSFRRLLFEFVYFSSGTNGGYLDKYFQTRFAVFYCLITTRKKVPQIARRKFSHSISFLLYVFPSIALFPFLLMWMRSFGLFFTRRVCFTF